MFSVYPFRTSERAGPVDGFQVIVLYCKIWKEYQDQHPDAKYIPVVFPLVLYHGKASWNSPMRLRDLIEGDDDFSEFIPDFTYQLIDLGEYDDEMLALGEEMALGVVLYLLRESPKNKLPNSANPR